MSPSLIQSVIFRSYGAGTNVYACGYKHFVPTGREDTSSAAMGWNTGSPAVFKSE